MSAGPARRALNHAPPALRGEMPKPAPAQGQAAVPTHRCGCTWPNGGGLPPSLLPPLRHTLVSVTPALSVIPAEAGIHAICGGQGRSQCSTAPDHPRRAGGSGGPSGGWRLVARLGGRMDSCLRRNDGGGAGMAEGWEWRKSLSWSRVRTAESMLTVRPQQLAPCSPDRQSRPLARAVCSPAQRLHAHAARDPQRDAQTPHALARLEPQQRPLS